mmetsp:Transcript_2653/g.7509  ORF Transcript_2653/g.7509 Transcript_2653/m.7509 type:complete len:367 (-) Transcript_2653:259-1359(-)|eukprot:CAMPEP_0117664914 /NCGR_PEP_ID=MMETSP0804-20121206/9500_1 /TAXON_ID=1074897 /ORGANISM="Tetraselmis astigmatica, Strain CCMP880" /LENGTH=366 /DNA_ID=CAMNT_0005472231 /DNA_START=232 /DNA_END=1332 /DNA_ORIENTATION=+
MACSIVSSATRPRALLSRCAGPGRHSLREWHSSFAGGSLLSNPLTQSSGAPRATTASRSTPLIVCRGRRALGELLQLGVDKAAKPATPLRAGKVSPMRPVPKHIPRPPYADSGVLPDMPDEYQIHNEEQIVKMRAACKLAAEVRDKAGELVKPGVTTEEIDIFVHEMIVNAGAYPSPLNYGKFPKSVCTSVNECICHGIPDSRPLEDGDIVNIDVTVFLDGHHGDCSKTFLCGTVTPEAKRLVEANEKGLAAAIKECGPGVPFNRIGNAIQRVADSNKYGIVRSFVGHGVGRIFHAAPMILHHKNNEPGVMQEGMTFTIEPQFSMGSTREKYWGDKWTAVTTDGTLTAQCEHTLLITKDGVDILTL